ncbi:MAG: hypothetical protein AAF682_15600 [Planctomycetota bacterium]
MKAALPLLPTFAAFLLASLCAATPSQATGAVDWQAAFAPAPGADDGVRALTRFDDGSGAGEELYVGGDFLAVAGTSASRIVKWDGSQWSPLGEGLDGAVHALEVFDDGSGPALYAGGAFLTADGIPAPGVARWDGQAWSAVGAGVDGEVYALTVFDDGQTSRLVAGGLFTTSAATSANNVAIWDGASWGALGSGTSHSVYALTTYDGGGGNELFVGGFFSFADGLPVSNIARWDGASWSAVGLGVEGSVRAFLEFDDGSGPELYVAGNLVKAGGVTSVGVARWNGAAWSPVDGAASALVFGDFINALAVFDDGSGGGDALYLAGERVALRFDGATWTALGTTDGFVRALAVFDTGAGPELVAGGAFTCFDATHTPRLARLAGAAFGPLGAASTILPTDLAVFDGAEGPVVYATGTTGCGETPIFARWTGKAWWPIDLGMTVETLEVLDDGSGPALYAAGAAPIGPSGEMRVLRFDGHSWSRLGQDSISGSACALTVFDDGAGPSLYVGGGFFGGGTTPDKIARWDGQAWVQVGSGFGWVNGGIRALAVLEDASGAALYAIGTSTGSLIRRWDGQDWSDPGGGIQAFNLYSLAVHDDGTGDALYVGGFFGLAGGVSAVNIARWKDGAWSALGSGVDYVVYALESFDDGVNGPALFVGGDFQAAGGVPTANIARWQGQTWSAVGAGMTKSVVALHAAHDTASDAPALFVGSDDGFSPAGDGYVARWGQAGKAAPLWGCAGSPLTLTPVSAEMKVASSYSAALDGAQPSAALAFLLAGVDQTDANGCGVAVGGLGELLLGANPVPVATTPVVAGAALHQFTVPNQPALVGVEVVVQSAALGAAIEVSNGLAVTVTN